MCKTGEHIWSADQLHMNLIIHRDEASIKQAEACKLRKVCNTSSAMYWKDMSLFNTMKAFVNHNEAFQVRYSLRFVDLGIEYIVDDTMSSDYLPSKMHRTYVL